jgi:hypothetical protein
MHFSKIYIQQNFVPDIVVDQFGRKVIGVEITMNEGESLEEAKTTAENYIKEYIEKNTLYHSPAFISESLPPEPAVLPSIQKEKPLSEMTFEEQIMSCNDIKVLESYKLLAKQNAFFQSVYNKRFLDLKKTGNATSIGLCPDVSKTEIGIGFYNEAGNITGYVKTIHP